MGAFIHQHEALIFWLSIASVIGLVASAVLIPWMLVRIPPDYFSNKEYRKHQWSGYPPVIRGALHFIKNIFGLLFIVSGIIMLLIPGQGILTIIIGIILTDFPYKYNIEQWIISRPAILKAINQLRAKAKQSPIVRPSGLGSGGAI